MCCVGGNESGIEQININNVRSCARHESGFFIMEKSKGVAYLLWFLGIGGWLGLHRFYLGRTGTGILWILTGGLLGFGCIYDLFTLGSKVELHNLRIEEENMRQEMRENMMMTQQSIASTSAAVAAAVNASAVTKKEDC